MTAQVTVMSKAAKPAAAVKDKPYVPTVTREKLLPSCVIAGQIERQEIGSKTRPNPDDWRAACPGAARSRLGDIRLCSDEYHDEHPKCRLCQITVDDIDDLTTDLCCVNEIACLDRRAAASEANPRMQMFKECQQEAAIERARVNALRDPDARTRPARVGRSANSNLPRKVAPKPDMILDCRCEHCGEPTKGGKFVAGHDAKLKGELLTAAKELDAEALAEIITRSWLKEGTKTTILAHRRKLAKTNPKAKKVGAAEFGLNETEDLFATAEAVVQSTTSRQFLTNRVMARVGEE